MDLEWGRVWAISGLVVMLASCHISFSDWLWCVVSVFLEFENKVVHRSRASDINYKQLEGFSPSSGTCVAVSYFFCSLGIIVHAE